MKPFFRACDKFQILQIVEAKNLFFDFRIVATKSNHRHQCESAARHIKINAFLQMTSIPQILSPPFNARLIFESESESAQSSHISTHSTSSPTRAEKSWMNFFCASKFFLSIRLACQKNTPNFFGAFSNYFIDTSSISNPI